LIAEEITMATNKVISAIQRLPALLPDMPYEAYDNPAPMARITRKTSTEKKLILLISISSII
jgi:hypothetical protein